MKLAIFDVSIIALYLVFMICIAVFFAKRKFASFDDYFLAGGKLSVPVLIATFTSTYFGVDSLTGDAEMGYGMGISGFFSYCLVAAVLMIVLALLGFRIKEKLGDAKTTIEVIGKTYGPVSRVCCAIGSLCYTMPIVNIMGMGIAFSIVLNIPYWLGVLISAVISTIYTYFGGLAAVTVTDTINFAIISCGVAIAGYLGWNSLGNENILRGLTNYVGGDPLFYFSPTGGWLTAGLIITYAITAISVLCEPTLFQRIFAAKDGASIRQALIIGAVIYAAYSVVATLIGVLAAASVGLGAMEIGSASSSLISYAVTYLPAGILGVFLAGFLAAGVSTCDSMLLVAGSNFAYDLYEPISRKKHEGAALIKLTKRGILIASAISLILAFAFGRIMGAWVFVASMLANTTLVVLYTALFLKGKKSRLAGEVSSLAGLVGTLVCYFGIGVFGYYDATWGTYMLDVNLFGRVIPIWQEYNILLVLPATAVIYFAIHLLDKSRKEGN